MDENQVDPDIQQPDDESPESGWKTGVIVLAVAVVILIGVIVGYLVAGDDDDPVATPSTTTSTTLPPVTTTTAANPATTSVEPTTTLPLGTPAPTVPPDTSVEGQITFTAVEDTFIDASDTATPQGLEPGLALENDPPELKMALIRFDLTGLPTDQELSAARLLLFVEAGGEGAVTVHTVDGEWSEVDTTSANAPEVGTTVAAVEAGFAELTYIEFDISGLITGDGVLDLYVATSSPRSTELGSRESASPPQLVVEWGN